MALRPAQCRSFCGNSTTPRKTQHLVDPDKNVHLMDPAKSSSNASLNTTRFTEEELANRRAPEERDDGRSKHWIVVDVLPCFL